MGQIIGTNLNTRNMVTSNKANYTLPTSTKPTYVAPKTTPLQSAPKDLTANDKAYIQSLANTGTAGQKAWAASQGYNPTQSTPSPITTPSPLETPLPVEPLAEKPQTTQTYDTTGVLNDLKQAQINAMMGNLDKSLNNSLVNLDQQQAGLGQTYYDKRNQAAAESDIGAMNFAQRAAARGISGNAAAMPEIYRNSALQGQVGSLNQQEAAANAGIDANRASLRNNYESDIVSAKAGIEAQALQNYISQMNTDRQFGLSEAGLTGTYNGAQTMQGQAQELSNQMAELDLNAKEIENSYLPQTLKDQATLLKQQVEMGRLAPATALAQLNQIKKETANIGASTALGYANLNYSKTQDALNNSTKTYNDAVSNINSLYVTPLVNGGNQINKVGLRPYILSLNLPDAQTTQLINLYGV